MDRGRKAALPQVDSASNMVAEEGEYIVTATSNLRGSEPISFPIKADSAKQATQLARRFFIGARFDVQPAE